MFSDGATCHVAGQVHRHNLRIWGNERPMILLNLSMIALQLMCGVFLPEIARLAHISLRNVL
jgi:hypothetical protein